MARWNSQQCLTNTNTTLSTVVGGGTAGTTAWDNDTTRSDIITSNWIDTSMTEVLFFEWQLENTMGTAPTTLVQQLEEVAYAELTMTSVYSNKPIGILRSPVIFEFPDLQNANGTLTDNGGTSAYPGTVSVVGVPRGVGVVSVYASFAPNTPGSKVVPAYSVPSIGLANTAHDNPNYVIDGYQCPTNTLGDYTYSSLELFYAYDASVESDGTITQSKSHLSQDMAIASKLQASLKVVNCFSYSKMTDSYQ